MDRTHSDSAGKDPPGQSAMETPEDRDLPHHPRRAAEPPVEYSQEPTSAYGNSALRTDSSSSVVSLKLLFLKLTRTRVRKVKRILGLAGVVGGFVWIVVIFVNREGEESEVSRNRILALAFLGMLLGMWGLLSSLRPTLGKAARVSLTGFIVGLGLMTLGTFVEYWILFRLPHQGGNGSFARGLSWMTVLLGALFVCGFSVATGVFWLRSRVKPRWLGLMFLLFLPVTVMLALIHRVGAALPIAFLSSVGLLLDLKLASDLHRRDIGSVPSN